MRTRGGRWLWVGLAAASTAAHAQSYRDVPLGGRTATMGGAATAAGNDSAMPYLNPAGMAGVPGDVFGLSATVYGVTRRTLRGVFFPGGFDTSAYGRYEPGRESFATNDTFELPSSAMYFRHLSADGAPVRHKLGVSLVIPTAERMSYSGNTTGAFPDVAGRLSLSQAVSRSMTDYWLGPSYAVAVGDRLRVGVSLFAIYRTEFATQSQDNAIQLFSGSGIVTGASTLTREDRGWGAALVVGAQAEIARNVWVGFGAATPSLPIDGSSVGSASGRVFADSTTTHIGTTRAAEYSFRTPLRLNAGAAYEDRRRLTIAADVQYYAPVTQAERSRGAGRVETSFPGDIARSVVVPIDDQRGTTAVIAASVGGEVCVTDAVALRVGVFTDQSPRKALGSAAIDLWQTRANRRGLSAGVGVRLGSFDTTLGGQYVRGEGTYGAQNFLGKGASFDQPTVPRSYREDTVMLLLSGAVTRDEARRQIEAAAPIGGPSGSVELAPGGAGGAR